MFDRLFSNNKAELPTCEGFGPSVLGSRPGANVRERIADSHVISRGMTGTFPLSGVHK